MRRLIWIFTGRTCPKVPFMTLWIKTCSYFNFLQVRERKIADLVNIFNKPKCMAWRKIRSNPVTSLVAIIIVRQCNTIAETLIFLTIKAPRKTASENVVCLCRLLYSCKLFKPIFAYRQTVLTQIRLLLKERFDLGPHCLQKWLLKSQADDKGDDNSCDWRFKG